MNSTLPRESSSTRDREPALELGDQVRRLGNMERARGDEQDVVGLDRAVLGRDRGPFHDRQEVALHALAGNVGAVCFAARDLVDLVEEDDARLLDALERFLDDLVHVDELRRLFLDQEAERIRYLDLAPLGLLGQQPAEHLLQVHLDLFHADVRDDAEGHDLFLLLELHHPLVELSLPELLAELLARARVLLLLFGGRRCRNPARS